MCRHLPTVHGIHGSCWRSDSPLWLPWEHSTISHQATAARRNQWEREHSREHSRSMLPPPAEQVSWFVKYKNQKWNVTRFNPNDSHVTGK